jgi:DHA2 family multidrug resistance protein-like MFS transporter
MSDMRSTSGRPERSRWWALAGISLGLLAVGLDTTVLSLALPTLAGALRASEGDLQWFVTSYTLALTAAMLPAGLLGDRYGRRAVILGALVAFGAASLACAYAPSSAAFIAARVVLGAAGAAMVVMALSLITVLFDEAERPRAIGIWGAANFLALPIGPIAGGWILANAWWGWVFILNVPVVVIGIVAVLALVPESRSERRVTIDWAGILSSGAGLVLLMYGLIEAGAHGWTDTAAAVPSVAGLVALASFVAWEARLAARGGVPLVDLGLFRSRAFTGGVLLAGVAIFGLFGILFVLPQYWQAVQGLDAQGAGFRMLPLIAGMVLGAIPADRVAARFGPARTVASGITLLALALAAGSRTTGDAGGSGPNDAVAAAWTLLVGLGAGMGLSTAASGAVSELDAERSGVGAALVQAVVKLGPAFGATVLGSVLAASYRSQVPVAGLPADAAEAVRSSVFGGLGVAAQSGSAALAEGVRMAFVDAMGDALRTAAVIVAIGAPLALALLPRRRDMAGVERAESEHEPAIATS